MWLSKNMKQKKDRLQPETASVTLSRSDSMEAGGSAALRNIDTFAPYGYSCVVPVGEDVMVIPSSSGSAIMGSRMESKVLESGEISITSQGGASILLKNNGTVVINGLVINAEGEIEQ